MSRDWAITYGSFNVGGASAPTRQIDGEVRRTLDNTFETTVVEFDFITTATSDSAFATEVLACENAFRIPRLDFTHTQAGQTIISLKQSDNTGLDCNPTIIKTGDPADTGHSIKYHVRLEFGRPADNTNTAGRRFSTITVSYSPSRQRTVTIDGMYTALSNNGSYEQYLASIAAFATTATNAIDNTAKWEKIGEPKVDQNISDKFTNFTIVFKEVIYNQGTGTLDVPELIDPTLLIDVERFSWDSSDPSGFSTNGGGSNSSGGSNAFPSGDVDTTVGGGSTGPGTTTSQGNEKPWIINLSYTVGVDKTITKDLVNEYKNVVRPLLLQAAQQEAAGAGLNLIEDKPEYDPYYNRINVSMQFIAYINKTIERHVTISDRTNTGLVIHGLWSSGVFDSYEHQGQALRLRTIFEEFVAIDTYNGAVMAMIESLFDGAATQSSLGSNWRVISREPKGTSINRGIPDGGQTNYIASWAIETICQYGNFRTANTTTAGTVGTGVAT